MRDFVKIILAFAIGISFYWVGKACASIPTEETRIKIAVVDTGVDVMQEGIRPLLCVNGHKSFSDNEPLKDSNPDKHGTNVIGLIGKNIDPTKYCILVVKFFDGKKGDNVKRFEESVRYATSQGVKYMNLSVVGHGSISSEREAIRLALEAGIKIAVSSGNENLDLDKKCDCFPACYGQEFDPEKFHVVGSSTRHGILHPYSNHGSVVKYLEDGTEVGDPPMTGTSQSCAIHMGKWISGKVK